MINVCNDGDISNIFATHFFLTRYKFACLLTQDGQIGKVNSCYPANKSNISLQTNAKVPSLKLKSLKFPPWRVILKIIEHESTTIHNPPLLHELRSEALSKEVICDNWRHCREWSQILWAMRTTSHNKRSQSPEVSLVRIHGAAQMEQL